MGTTVAGDLVSIIATPLANQNDVEELGLVRAGFGEEVLQLLTSDVARARLEQSRETVEQDPAGDQRPQVHGFVSTESAGPQGMIRDRPADRQQWSEATLAMSGLRIASDSDLTCDADVTELGRLGKSIQRIISQIATSAVELTK